MQLEGRTALITGAGSGIGRALAIEAARRGMMVALVGRRCPPLAETAALMAPGAACLVFPGDVTDPRARRQLRETLARQWGRLDVLVNNAGLLMAGPLSEADDLALERLMATNVVAPLALVRELLPLLRAGTPSRVVNVGSMLGDIGHPLFAAYSASKFALRGFSSAIRRELRGLGVGVCHVAPRGVLTGATVAIEPLMRRLAMPLDRPEALAGRIWDAVARDARDVYPGVRERLFAAVERLLPRLVDRAVASRLRAAGLAELAAGGCGRDDGGKQRAAYLGNVLTGVVLAVLLASAAPSARAATGAATGAEAAPPGMAAGIRHIEYEWARVEYRMTDDGQRLQRLEALAAEAAALVRRFPGRAEPLVWQGVVASTEAGVAGPFHALGLAKDARRMFEDAGRIDPRALDGAVPMSLGLLYYRVPGFPLGFGDDDKARGYLRQALAIDPDNLDTNYFYGDFLYRQGEYAEARRALAHALEAPTHPDRPVWDSGRRAEVRALLARIDARMAAR